MFDGFNNDINIAKVDCTDESAKLICQQFGVRGYPTLKFLREDSFYNFRGQRTIPGLRDFAVNQGYLETQEEETGAIPRRLEGMEKFQKESKDFLDQLAVGID